MPISDDNIRISVTIPRIVNERLKLVAKTKGRTVSNLLSALIIKYIEKNLPDNK